VKNLSTPKKNQLLLLSILWLLCNNAATNAQSTSTAPPETMKVSLFQTQTNGTFILADGNLTVYDDSFLNEIGDDALKMDNFGENFGIARDGVNLSVEQRKKINIYDTTFFVMWNMQRRSYRLRIINKNLNHLGLLGNFIDTYLNTRTPLLLNDTNYIDFTVNSIPASSASNRFRVEYRNPLLMPLSSSFISFSAQEKLNIISLQWTVSSPRETKEFVVEHATDAIHFSAIETVKADKPEATGKYATIDEANRNGDQFYRIKMISLTGQVEYSTIFKVNVKKALNAQDFIIYPNPVEQKTVNILFPSGSLGKYNISLINNTGVIQKLPSVQVIQSQRLHKLVLPANTNSGIFQLKISDSNNQFIVKSINVL